MTIGEILFRVQVVSPINREETDMPRLTKYQKMVHAAFLAEARKLYPHGFYNAEHESTALAFYTAGWADALKAEAKELRAAK